MRLDELRLIKQIRRSGDRAAADELVRRYYDGIHGFVKLWANFEWIGVGASIAALAALSGVAAAYFKRIDYVRLLLLGRQRFPNLELKTVEGEAFELFDPAYDTVISHDYFFVSKMYAMSAIEPNSLRISKKKHRYKSRVIYERADRGTHSSERKVGLGNDCRNLYVPVN